MSALEFMISSAGNSGFLKPGRHKVILLQKSHLGDRVIKQVPMGVVSTLLEEELLVDLLNFLAWGGNAVDKFLVRPRLRE